VTDHDPYALIIAIGSAAISTLLGLLIASIKKQATQLSDEVKALTDAITGREGLFMRLVRAEGHVENYRVEIAALKAGTLSREIFERATNEQNSKLNTIDAKVDLVDRMIRPMPSR
jgi:hypothetical protein